MAVLEDSYLCCDESYHKVLVEEKNSRGKGVRQGYIWAAVAVKQKLILYLYENGSRSGKVLLTFFPNMRGQYKVTHTVRIENWKVTPIRELKESPACSMSKEVP